MGCGMQLSVERSVQPFSTPKGQNMENETESVLARIDSHVKGLAEF
jgi:hypothetical protein